ncbi:MAG: cytochrome C [Thermodesulfovibrionales bacterium]
MGKKTRVYSLFSTVVLLACVHGAQAQEVRYTTHIQPLFQEKCAVCHDNEAAPEYQAFKGEKEMWLAKGKGMRMNTYSHLIFYTAWPDTGALMRRLDDGNNTRDGKPGNMHRYLGTTDEERQRNLALFKAWVGTWTLDRWPEITKEEMDGISVRY